MNRLLSRLSAHRVKFVARGLAPAAMAGCTLVSCVASLDTFVHNATHCSAVSESTCEGAGDDIFRQVCVRCDEPYPWEAHGIPADAPVRIDVELADGNKNDAWFIPASGEASNVTLVYGHGNRAGIEHYLNRIGLLYKTGMNLFVVEYRGYGKSSDPNEPTEEQLYDDTLRARAALDAHLGNEAGPVYYYGYSVGGLPMVQLAIDRKPCALLLEAPWPSVQAFSNDSTHVGLPASFLTTGSYDNIGKISQVQAPLFVVHGAADDFILIEHSEALVASANAPKSLLRVEGAGHGNGGDDVPTVLGESAYLAWVRAATVESGCGE